MCKREFYLFPIFIWVFFLRLQNSKKSRPRSWPIRITKESTNQTSQSCPNVNKCSRRKTRENEYDKITMNLAFHFIGWACGARRDSFSQSRNEETQWQSYQKITRGFYLSITQEKDFVKKMKNFQSGLMNCENNKSARFCYEIQMVQQLERGWRV